jgi:2-oxoglutarate dehydrogenase complex dehydrogenase (E1) component-like enzyme
MDMKDKAQNIHLARPERYLQLAAQDNMMICKLYNTSKFFHALSRQQAVGL